MYLSIIIPYYKAYESVVSTLDNLVTQIKDNYAHTVEIVLVDDGCHEYKLDVYKDTYDFINIIHLSSNSGGASHPRNVGLDFVQNKPISVLNNTFITFIDSDDSVASNYVSVIMSAISTLKFDYCYFKWKHHLYGVINTNPLPPIWNCSVWDIIYKFNIIGDNRFKEYLKIGEDYDFNVNVLRGVKENIDECLYFYADTPNSLSKGA